MTELFTEVQTWPRWEKYSGDSPMTFTCTLLEVWYKELSFTFILSSDNLQKPNCRMLSLDFRDRTPWHSVSWLQSTAASILLRRWCPSHVMKALEIGLTIRNFVPWTSRRRWIKIKVAHRTPCIVLTPVKRKFGSTSTNSKVKISITKHNHVCV